ncbi:hypothetical protein PV326_008276 [Microctonus aethiopoides]|nr:hypothetical protein PV326_008276 [Microctonus aethiopoides]
MEPSLYLQAIQNVAGSTPGEKYETLNRIAREIVVLSQGQNDTIQVQLLLKVPEVLVPLVKVEIAKILRQPDGIVEALTSDDTFIFHCALQAKWFFDGSIENVTDIKYFQDRIFSCISIKNRHKLIAKLSIYLAANKKENIAEEFYLTLSDLHGVKVSEPLLLACSESFVWKTIIKRQLVLSVRIVGQLYQKYPHVIVKYLQLSKPSDEPYQRNLHVISICHYIDFLPRLINKHVNIYADLIVANSVKKKILSRKCTKKFLKYGTEILIQKPDKFVPIMDLKVITSELTKEQFKLLLRNLFLINKSDKYLKFSFMEMYKYLEHYPSDEKVSFILSTYEEVYNESFLDQNDLIGSEVLKLLSPDDRVKVARKKLEKDPSWHRYYQYSKSWRCYLPICESIPIIKNEINKTPLPERRTGLLEQLIYSCKVNNDEDALLKVLEYIESRHRNERGDILLDVFGTLLREFQAQNLSFHHWKILDDIMQLLHIKDQLKSRCHTTEKLFIAKIHFNLINKLSITEAIKSLFDIKIDCDSHWSILENYPEYERKCLEEFINILPSSAPKDESKIEFISKFLYAINKFNERISCTKNEIEPIKVENYPWLSAEISQIVSDGDDNYYTVRTLRYNLKVHNLNLYHAWVKEKTEIEVDLSSVEKFNKWMKNPDKIKIHWEKFLSECESITYHKYARRFIKKCRWYQDLPIKFAEKCFKDLTENKDTQALIVLALLYDGPAFERIINPYLPTSSVIDVASESAEKNYSIMKSIPRALSFVNPPVSLDVTLKYCRKNIIHMAGNWIQLLALQTPVDKLIPITIKLMDQPVSISKHFIRIFIKIANINELHSVLMNLPRTEKHLTIRTLVFNKIFDLFVTNPSHITWLLLNEYIDRLTADDKEKLSTICHLHRIPNEYIWDIPDPLDPNVYPANYMVDTSMIGILWYIRDNKIRKQFIDVTLNSFRSVLSPLQAPLFYSYYIFASLYRGDEMSRDEYVIQIGNIILSLINTFSGGFVTELIKVLIKCLKLLWEDDDLCEEITIDIIEVLLKLNIDHAITLPAVIAMLEVIKKNNERYTEILRILRKRKNPAAIAYACMQINKSNVTNNNSPMYLEAIQNATGSTPGEKNKIKI